MSKGKRGVDEAKELPWICRLEPERNWTEIVFQVEALSGSVESDSI